ncbi:MAG: hypothetical protein WCQ57_02880 [Verrucomicrobiota bacterium]
MDDLRKMVRAAEARQKTIDAELQKHKEAQAERELQAAIRVVVAAPSAFEAAQQKYKEELARSEMFKEELARSVQQSGRLDLDDVFVKGGRKVRQVPVEK